MLLKRMTLLRDTHELGPMSFVKAREYCHALVANGKMLAASLIAAYKGQTLCYILNSKNVDLDLHETNKHKLYDLKTKGGKQLIKVVPSDLVFEGAEYDQFHKDMKLINLFWCFVLFALGQEFPDLEHQLMQYQNDGYEDGEELKDTDFMIYLWEYIVATHMDAQDLVVDDVIRKKNGFTFIPGPFCLLKLTKNARTQILCHDGVPGVKCGHGTVQNDQDNTIRGQVELPAGTAYTMSDIGAYGGPHHHIHNNLISGSNKWGCFIGPSTTTAQRPFEKKIFELRKIKKNKLKMLRTRRKSKMK